jgi:hypothetical protein
VGAKLSSPGFDARVTQTRIKQGRVDIRNAHIHWLSLMVCV